MPLRVGRLETVRGVPVQSAAWGAACRAWGGMAGAVAIAADVRRLSSHPRRVVGGRSPDDLDRLGRPTYTAEQRKELADEVRPAQEEVMPNAKGIRSRRMVCRRAHLAILDRQGGMRITPGVSPAPRRHGAGVSGSLPAVTALAVYFDESERENVCAVAGYLAPKELWDDFFYPKWRHLLHWATRRSCPLSEFKAGDCVQGQGDFRGMPEGDRRAIVDAAADIIVEMCRTKNCIGAAAVMFHPGIIDATGLTKRQASKLRYRAQKHAYAFTLGMCLYDTLRVGLEFCGTDGIQPVLDRRDGFTQVALRNWRLIAEFLRSNGRCEEPVSRDSRVFLALQAADLLAWETKEEAWWRLDGNYPVSHVLRRLVATNAHFARVLTPELVHSGILGRLGDTPYLYKADHNVRSPLLWHGAHFTPAKGRMILGSDGRPR